MLSKISNRVRDWMNRTEPPLDPQQAANSINDPLNALSIQPENETNVDTNKNVHHNGSSSEDRDNVENLQVEKEGRSENGGKFEVVGLAEVERIRSVSFPARCEAEDCSNVDQVILIGRRNTNHPADRKPQAGKVNGKEKSVDSSVHKMNEKDDSKSEQINCKKFDSALGSNSANARRASRRKKTSPKVEYNFMGLPIRQGEKDCSEFMNYGSCESGVDCRFNHPDPTSVEGSDSQSGQSNEGPIVSPGVPQSTVGFSSPAGFDNGPPPACAPSRFPSTLGFSSPAAFDNCPPPRPPNVPSRFPSTLGLSSPAAFDNCPPRPPPSVPLRFPSTLGLSSPAGFDNCPPPPSFPSRFPSNFEPLPPVPLSQCPPYAPMMYPPNHGVPCWPESFPYQAPIHLPERTMQMPSVYPTNSRPPERDIYTHHRPPIFVDEFPQRPGQPECSYFLKTGNCTYGSACRFHHPKNWSAKSAASGHRVSGPPLRPPVQPAIPKAVVPPSRGASVSKKFVGQNSVSNAHKSKPMQPMVTLKKGSSNSSVRCDLCGVECPDIQNYNLHLTGKKHVSNLLQLHASRTSLEAKPVESMEATKKEDDSGSEVAIPCGKDTFAITNLASDLEADIQKSSSAIEMGPSANVKGSVTSLETDFEAKKHECEGIGASGGEGVAADTTVSDLEAKKEKVLESGIAAESLRTCTLCNVVCIGETAFAEHLRGKKHLAKCKQDCSHCMHDGSCMSPADSMLSSPDPTSVGASDSQSGHSIEESVVSPNASHSVQQDGVTSASLDPASMTDPNPKSEDVVNNQKTNNDQFVWCEICKVRCTSLIGLRHHERGKNHTKNVKKFQTAMSESTTTSPSKDSGVDCWLSHPEPTSEEQVHVASVTNSDPASVTNPSRESAEVASKKTNTNQFVWCEVCKIRCTSITDLKSHEQGKKHKIIEEAAKKISCEVCKINFSCTEDLKNHKYGKKHRANVEKAQTNPKTDPTPSSASSVAGGSQDLEAKKQKVLEHGAPADAVRICAYCNVVCTSEKMYDNHVAGPKHVAAVLKLKQVAESGRWTELNPDR